MSTINLSGIPGEPIRQQLAALVADGMSPEDAADKVLAPYRPAPLADLAWSVVRNEAHGLVRKHHRRVEDQALGEGGKQARWQAKMRLPVTTFRLGDGTEVEWGKASVAQHRARVAWQRVQITAIETDIARHLRAVELIEERRVGCLDDIPGWVDLLPDVASSGVDAPSSVGARKPVTGGDGRVGDGSGTVSTGAGAFGRDRSRIAVKPQVRD